MRPAYWPELDGLRALAVSGVILFHVGGPRQLGGRLGVDVFFVLSGFLITSLLSAEASTTGGVALGPFYGRRARRLLPALFATVVLTVVVYAVFVDGELRQATLWPGAPAALGYIAAWVVAFGGQTGAFAHTWSLSVEEHFYFLWPPLLLLISTRSVHPLRWVGATYSVAAAWFLAISALDDSRSIYFRPDTRMHQLLAGCLLAFVVSRVSARTWRRLGIPAAFGLAGVVVAYPTLAEHRATSTAVTLAVGPLAAAVIAHLVTGPGVLAGRCLRSSAMVWVGQRSYGMYLIHVPVQFLLATRGDAIATGAPMVLVTIVITFVLAALSFRWVESPVRRRFAPAEGGARLLSLGAAP